MERRDGAPAGRGTRGASGDASIETAKAPAGQIRTIVARSEPATTRIGSSIRQTQVRTTRCGPVRTCQFTVPRVGAIKTAMHLEPAHGPPSRHIRRSKPESATISSPRSHTMPRLQLPPQALRTTTLSLLVLFGAAACDDSTPVSPSKISAPAVSRSLQVAQQHTLDRQAISLVEVDISAIGPFVPGRAIAVLAQARTKISTRIEFTILGLDIAEAGRAGSPCLGPILS